MSLAVGACCGVLDGNPFCCPVTGSSFGAAAGSSLFARMQHPYTPAASSSLARHVWLRHIGSGTRFRPGRRTR